jgi:AraC-like DNA-binding protein
MKYAEYAPCSLLKPYVIRFWEVEFDIPKGKVTHQPDCCTASTHLIFCLKTILKTLQNRKIISAYPANLVTPLTVPVINILEGVHLSVGVEFTTTGFHKLWQIPMQEITSSGAVLHDLQALIGAEALCVYWQLIETDCSAARFSILEHFLLSRLKKTCTRYGLVEGAIRVIEQKPRSLQIRSIAQQLHCTERTLERHFKDQLGISPKTYARIQRFIQIRNQLFENPNWTWRQALADGEYYDQAHFIKEFVEFSGRPPSAYISHMNKAEEFFAKRFN